MKRIGLCLTLLLSLCKVGQAITYQSVRASTATILTPAIQVGTMNLSSGTITNLNASNVRVRFGVVASTFTGDGSGLTNLSGTTLGPGNTNYIQLRDTLQTGATFYTSSGTVVNGTIQNLNASTTFLLNNQAGTAGQSIQSAGSSAIPTWADVPSAILTTTSTWTAAQTFRSSVTFTSSATIKGPIVLGAALNPGTTFDYLLSQSSNTAPTWSHAGLVLQSSMTLVSNSSATTVTNFALTNIAATFTPKFATSKVRISYSGPVLNSNVALDSCFVTIFQGSTNLAPGGAAAGICFVNSGVTSSLTSNCGITLYDSPATVSPVTYAVRMKTSAASATCTTSNTTGSILLIEEIGQ